MKLREQNTGLTMSKTTVDPTIVPDFCFILKSSHGFNAELSELEVMASYWGMLSFLKKDRWRDFGATESTSYLSDSDKERILSDLSEEKKRLIQQDFIEASQGGVIDDSCLRLRSDFILHHYPDQCTQHEKQTSIVAKKRLRALEEGRKELEKVLAMLAVIV